MIPIPVLVLLGLVWLFLYIVIGAIIGVLTVVIYFTLIGGKESGKKYLRGFVTGKRISLDESYNHTTHQYETQEQSDPDGWYGAVPAGIVWPATVVVLILGTIIYCLGRYVAIFPYKLFKSVGVYTAKALVERNG